MLLLGVAVAAAAPAGAQEVERLSGTGAVRDTGARSADLSVEVRTSRQNVLRATIGDGSGTISVDTGSGSIRVLADG